MTALHDPAGPLPGSEEWAWAALMREVDKARADFDVPAFDVDPDRARAELARMAEDGGR